MTTTHLSVGRGIRSTQTLGVQQLQLNCISIVYIFVLNYAIYVVQHDTTVDEFKNKQQTIKKWRPRLVEVC